MGKDRTIDARMQAALARLTDNEKECLRRRLRQQTAKEMALELGVSPHAVEKRLKMARAKLGLSSSLEAARLLVIASPKVVARITEEESSAVAELEEFIGKTIRFQADAQYLQEQFDVVLL